MTLKNPTPEMVTPAWGWRRCTPNLSANAIALEQGANFKESRMKTFVCQKNLPVNMVVMVRVGKGILRNP